MVFGFKQKSESELEKEALAAEKVRDQKDAKIKRLQEAKERVRLAKVASAEQKEAKKRRVKELKLRIAKAKNPRLFETVSNTKIILSKSGKALGTVASEGVSRLSQPRTTRSSSPRSRTVVKVVKAKCAKGKSRKSKSSKSRAPQFGQSQKTRRNNLRAASFFDF